MGTLLFHDTHDMIEKRVNGDEKREKFRKFENIL